MIMHPSETDPRKYMEPAKAAMKNVVLEKILMCKSMEKQNLIQNIYLLRELLKNHIIAGLITKQVTTLVLNCSQLLDIFNNRRCSFFMCLKGWSTVKSHTEAGKSCIKTKKTCAKACYSLVKLR